MRNLVINEFIEKTASESPTPGGGSVSALLAALSSSLAAMSASLTINKKGYEDIQNKMIEVKKELTEHGSLFLDSMNKDVEAFNNFMSAYRLKRDTEEEKEYRKSQIQLKAKEALFVQTELIEGIGKMIDTMKYCYYHGNVNVRSDALNAVIIARAAVLSCLSTIDANLIIIKDEELKSSVNNNVNRIKDEIINLEKELIKDSLSISL